MDSSARIIRTKLRLPFIRPGLVPRPRLQEQLALGLRGPLTLVTAPAGFGKTTLTALCVAGLGLPVAWLSLDKDDNQAGRLLAYLVAALREAVPAVGGEAAAMLASGPPPVPAEAVLTSLVNDLDRSGAELVLALDDYQMINSPAAHQEIAFLLDHCPAGLHLLIATRSDPPLPVTRLRARGQVVELRAADLRFTQAEALQFLTGEMGLQLDEQAVALLEERTEGWIAGLQMAALSMRGREDAAGFIQAFAGTNRYIMDFMLEEVLAREPAHIQDFLLRTSPLTRLCGPLCDALTGGSDGQAVLAELERRNLFVIPLDDERCWYRYHHLFADLLQSRLALLEKGTVEGLLSRAAEWCAQDGQVAEAIDYALAARDFPRAAQFIRRAWHTWTNNGEIEAVWSWLNALPPEIVRASASLGAAYCWMLWMTGRIDAIADRLADAERALEAGGEDRTLPVMLAALHAFVARYKGEFSDARDQAQRALRLIPDGLAPQSTAQLRMLADLALASACEGGGDLEQAAAAYQEIVQLSRQSANTAGIAITMRLTAVLRMLGRLREADSACRSALEAVETQGLAHLPAAGILHVAMSEIQVEHNDLAAAEESLAQGRELGQWSGRLDAQKNCAAAASRLRLAAQDPQGALAAIEETENALGDTHSPLSRAELLALKAGALVRQGLPEEAGACVSTAVDLAGWDRGVTGALVSLAAARVLAAREAPPIALAQLTHLLDAAEASGRLGVALELLLLRSLVLARQGSAAEAETDLERALDLANPQGYIRIFLDEGQAMQKLLARWLTHARPGPLREYAVRLLNQFDGGPADMAAPEANTGLIEPLSQRELEVLRLMAEGRTNLEISQQLIVARGTIKAHAVNIFRKLDAANRTEAVARARQLGILP